MATVKCGIKTQKVEMGPSGSPLHLFLEIMIPAPPSIISLFVFSHSCTICCSFPKVCSVNKKLDPANINKQGIRKTSREVDLDYSQQTLTAVLYMVLDYCQNETNAHRENGAKKYKCDIWCYVLICLFWI